MTDVSLRYVLFGEDRSAGKAMKGVADQSEKTGKAFHQSVVAGAAVAGAAVVAFGKVSVDQFKSVASETSGLMRTMGGTAESASRLRFAASQTGLGYESLSKSSVKFQKALQAEADAQFKAKVKAEEHNAKLKDQAMMLEGLHKPTDAQRVKLAALTEQIHAGTLSIARIKPGTEAFGLTLQDAAGKVLPLNQVLMEAADKFKGMSAGTEKTALAVKLFGKAGTEMLPFLNKGSEGIKELMKQSDKYGLTLTGSNLDALKKSKASQREWNASLQGLQVQIGAQVLPMMTKLVAVVRDQIIPIIVAVSGFFREHSTILGLVASFIGTVIVGMKAMVMVTKAWAIAQKLLNGEMAINPLGLIVVALAALAVGLIYAYNHSKTFRDIVQGAFKAVGAVFSTVWGLLKSGFSWVKGNWPYLAGALLGPFGLAAAAIYKNWDAIIGFLKKLPARVGSAISGVWDGLKTGLKSVLNWIIDKLNGFHFTIGGGSFMGVGLPSATIGISGIPRLANGGHILRGGSVLVGERGAERLTLPAGATVSPLGRDNGGGGGGGAQEIHLYIDGRELRMAQKRTTRLLGGTA
jgi:hypothetical protein